MVCIYADNLQVRKFLIYRLRLLDSVVYSPSYVQIQVVYYQTFVTAQYACMWLNSSFKLLQIKFYLCLYFRVICILLPCTYGNFIYFAGMLVMATRKVKMYCQYGMLWLWYLPICPQSIIKWQKKILIQALLSKRFLIFVCVYELYFMTVSLCILYCYWSIY